MKKYQILEIEIVMLQNDIITNSESGDNIVDMPDLPEDFRP